MKKLALTLLISCLFVAPLGAQTPTLGSSEYIVRAGDHLRIAVWPETKYSGEYPVEVTGSVYLPDVGEVKVAGLKLSELRERLRAQYGLLMNQPVISIMPVFTVGVLGGVRNPGTITVDPTQNVMDVIVRAGGFTQRAKTADVRIVRNGKVIVYDAQTALTTGESETLSLQSNDRIVVPEKHSLSLQSIMSALSMIGTAIIIYNQLKK